MNSEVLESIGWARSRLSALAMADVVTDRVHRHVLDLLKEIELPAIEIIGEVECLTRERDEARRVALEAVAAVKAYAEELNGEKTEHTFDGIVASWAWPPPLALRDVYEGDAILADGHDDSDGHVATADGLVSFRDMLQGARGKRVRVVVEVLPDEKGGGS